MRTCRPSLVAIVLVLAAVPAAAQIPFTVSSNITTADQYDLYPLTLDAGYTITATLVCDFDGVSRPLDPVLSVFFPGNTNTDDTSLADAFNDDGFGSDDDPNGVDCDAFDSSRVIFVAPETGTYTFRADGFGSATGPYTLAVNGVPGVLAVPTLDNVGLALLALTLAAGSLFLLRRRAPR